MRAQHFEYLAPARFDDELEVFVRVRRIGTTSMSWEFQAYEVANGEHLVSADQTLVAVELAHRRAVAVPEHVRRSVSQFEREVE
jgi:acyl-CoA thioester hydrolase